MLLKFLTILLFLAAEIALGIYSLAMSESLLARFLFFVLSAVFICIGVIKLSQKILPDDEELSK